MLILSKLHEDTRQVFQRFLASLVRVGDVLVRRSSEKDDVPSKREINLCVKNCTCCLYTQPGQSLIFMRGVY